MGVLGYFLITAALGLALGVKLPQPYPAARPITTILSDPQAKRPFTKTVDLNELQRTLDRHPYGRLYKANVFDCSDMSRETARFLQAEGYHTSVIGDDEKGGVGHAWAFVWTSKNSGWAIETASGESLGRRSAGEVMGDDWWDVLQAYGHDKSHFLNDWRAGRGYEFYYPSKGRGGLHVMDWNDPVLGRR